MLLAAVEKALTAFVISEDPSAIALKGPWGRGKTHYWNRFITAQSATRPQQGYAYVSLFGLTSLADLKRAVAMNARSLAMQADPSSRSHVETALGASWPLRLWNRFSGNAKSYASLLSRFADVGPVLDELMQNEAKDLIVCIDDLERRGDGLRLADVLGYCSHLKEGRGCRVVVILNEDAFSPEDAEEFARLSEKVFDHRVLYEPQTKECVAIAMPEGEARFASLRRHCEQLEITNIRILQRAKRLVGDFAPYVKLHDARIAERIAKTGALFTLCYYGRVGTHPPFAYVREFKDPMWARLSGTGEPSEERKQWDAQLTAYGFRSVDDLDREVAKYLDTGYVDAESLRALLKAMDRDIDAVRRKERFDAAWEALFASFDRNEEAVLGEVETALLDAAAMVDASFVNAIAFLLRRMDRAADATRVIRGWVDAVKVGNPAALDLSVHHPAGEVTDAELLGEIAKAVEAHRDPRSIEQVLKELVSQEGWSPADIRRLREGTVEEYVAVLRQWRGAELKAALALLTRLPANGPEFAETKAIAAEALRRIAADGPMNAWRVGRYVKL